MKQTKFLILIALIGILIFSWITRFYRLSQPASYVFDEQYHVPAVRLINDGDQRAFEWWHGAIDGKSYHDWLHPPLAKYLQGTAMNLWGDNAFAWRASSAIFGVMGVGLVFVLTQLVFQKPRVSLLAALLFSLDGLWLVQSRVAMNDVFLVVWLLLAAIVYLLYQQRRQLWLLPLIGLIFGLALATKWSAAFWLLGFLIWEVIKLVREKNSRLLPWLSFSWLLVPAAVYVLSFLPMFLQGKTLIDWWALQYQVLSYQVIGPASHLYQSGPGQWLFNWRPVWYWTNYLGRNIYALNNPLLAWWELIALLLSLKVIIGKSASKLSNSLSWLIMLLLISLVPWLAITRISFYYHFLPATPVLAILLAYWLDKLYLTNQPPSRKLIFWALIAALIWSFWLFFPLWVGLPVSSDLAEIFYFALPSWR